MYLVAGTQSDKSYANNVLVMKMYNLHKTKQKDDDNEDSDDDDEENESDAIKPKLNVSLINHNGAVNRIRVKYLTL